LRLLIFPCQIEKSKRSEFQNKLPGEKTAMQRSTFVSQCLTRPFVFICVLVIVKTGRAGDADTLWSETFEGDWTRDWHVDAGTWEVGVPTSGPNKPYRGQKCAATVLAGTYPANANTRLIRHTSFIVPSADQKPRLRFWHWYSFAGGDGGKVHIKVGNGAWQLIPETYINTGSAVWTSTLVDLSTFAGSTVQIAFHFSSDGNSAGVSWGWYIDEVSVITSPLQFRNPETWESGLGDWYADFGFWEVGKPTTGPHNVYQGQNCAATVLAGKYHENGNSRLISSPFVVPNAASNPSLQFWHCYSFSGGDEGKVQIRKGKGAWQTILGPYINDSGGVWSPVFYDLRAFADSTVQIAFYFTSDGNSAGLSWGWYIDNILVDPTTAVQEFSQGEPFRAFELFPNHPNPFNPSTTIAFDLPRPSEVTLKIFDLVGHEVATLAQQRMQAGRYNFKWDASGVPGGVYFYRLQTEAFTQTRKLLLLR